MRIVIFTILLSINLLANNTSYQVGVLINTFFKDENFSKMILKSVEKKINGLNKINVKLTPYKDESNILSDLKSKKIKFAVINPEVFFRNEEKIESYIYDQKWTLFISENLYEEYYLIKNKNSKADFSNLSNYQVNYREGVPVAKNWLATEIYKTYKKPYSNVVKNENFIKNRNQLALKPYFNKDEVSVIDKSDFDLMCELNPQLKNGLTIIKKSKPMFFNLIGLTHKSVKPEEYDMLYNFLHNIDYLLEGDEFSTIIPCVTNLHKLSEENMDILREFYKNYFTLKNKYD